jgi:hypothetical protein
LLALAHFPVTPERAFFVFTRTRYVSYYVWLTTRFFDVLSIFYDFVRKSRVRDVIVFDTRNETTNKKKKKKKSSYRTSHRHQRTILYGYRAAHEVKTLPTAAWRHNIILCIFIAAKIIQICHTISLIYTPLCAIDDIWLLNMIYYILLHTYRYEP